MMAFPKDAEGQEAADVLAFQAQELSRLMMRSQHNEEELDELLDRSSLFLAERGISVEDELEDALPQKEGGELLLIPTWDQTVEKARAAVGTDHALGELFTESELAEQDRLIADLNEAYRSINHLDDTDIAICAFAGVLAAAVDLLFVGIPQKSPDGLKARPLGDYVRRHFENVFPPEEMQRLANLPGAKVPYDVPYNKDYTTVEVEGLWPTMHRLYSLGHDPLLGFVVGVHDILTGKMTTIDKTGKVISQVVERYEGREERTIYASLCKQVLHLKTDVNTSMGLPAPLMGLFNLMQFGSFFEEEQTVAEVVQSMYYQGYDFVHFCAQTIPVMLSELIVRLCYSVKRIREGYSLKESIPVSTDRDKHPKLATMLFIAHSIATGIDAGRVLFTKNPMEISYPQWLVFAKYSFDQARWVLITEPHKRHRYVMNSIEAELDEVIDEVNDLFEDFADEYKVVYL